MGLLFSSGSSGAAPLLIRSSEWERSYSYCGTGSVYSYDDAAFMRQVLFIIPLIRAKVNRRLKKLDHMMIFM